MAKWRRSEWKWAKEWNERDHKSCLATLIMGGQAKISFAHARGVSGACPVRLFDKYEKVFLAKLGHQSRKRAERGWKSEAGPLSWKSGWKPSISRWFWAIGGYCIFFPFRDMAILKCPLGRIKFPMLKYGPVECLIWGMFQWAKQAFIGTVLWRYSHTRALFLPLTLFAISIPRLLGCTMRETENVLRLITIVCLTVTAALSTCSTGIFLIYFWFWSN